MARVELPEAVRFIWLKVCVEYLLTDFEIFLNYQVFSQPKLCYQELEAPDTYFVQLYLEKRAVFILVTSYWIEYLMRTIFCLLIFLLLSVVVTELDLYSLFTVPITSQFLFLKLQRNYFVMVTDNFHIVNPRVSSQSVSYLTQQSI